MLPLTTASILVATDLGDGSDAVVRSAGKLAHWMSAELHVLHVPGTHGSNRWKPASARHDGDAADRRLAAQLRRAVPEGIAPASQRIADESPLRAIVNRTQEVNADLVLLGPHRGGALGAYFVGTTADRMIRWADVPCMIVREPISLPVRHIGVPTDLSDAAGRALEAALAWRRWVETAGGAGAVRPEISLLHVGWPVDRFDNPAMEPDVIRPAMERQIEAALWRLGDGTRPRVRTEVLWKNDPAEAIVHWASTRGVELLMMSTHGWVRLRRALVGSIATGVARLAPCPVLLVPCAGRRAVDTGDSLTRDERQPLQVRASRRFV